jgi:hypothetical protein
LVRQCNRPAHHRNLHSRIGVELVTRSVQESSNICLLEQEFCRNQ